MDLIIETDIGHDPDDFFAICYLIASGVNVRAILISPGDPDQIAIARLICKETGLKIPIGTSKPNRNKLSSGSIHHQLLKEYNYPLEEKSDGLGVDIIKNVIADYPESELFIIGPVSSISQYMSKHPETHFKRATMQGGFLPYSIYFPKSPCLNFEGKNWMPTFNLNGDRPAGVTFFSGNIGERRMVGKNICHTVLFDKEVWEKRNNQVVVNNVAAYNLFEKAATMYLERHDSKKFHDPTAAVCHLHPEIGHWVRGNTVKEETGWTTKVNPEGDYILADIDYNLLWSNLLNCK